MYSILRKLLFQLSPELSHELSLDWLGAAERLRLLPLFCNQASYPVNIMGVEFPNPVGLAAGLDKNADYFEALHSLGFGFIEVGTITPLAQPGNPKPRLFRLEQQHAIINRMGFNNKGVNHLVARVQRRRPGQVLGINIGKNKSTSEEEALGDYLTCLNAVYDYADYITINISSPNTPGLRNLQFGETLNRLLEGLKQRQALLSAEKSRYVPLAVKIAPDMEDEDIISIANTLLQFELDAVIATNTTISREGVEASEFAKEAGGLSGLPVKQKSTHTIRVLHDNLRDRLPIIGVGGILSGEDAAEKIQAGAKLVQLYTGFIYRGPGLINESVEAIKTLG